MEILTGINNEWFAIKKIISDKSDRFTYEDNEIETFGGKKEVLIHSLMDRYKLDRMDAEKEVAKFWR